MNQFFQYLEVDLKDVLVIALCTEAFARLMFAQDWWTAFACPKRRPPLGISVEEQNWYGNLFVSSGLICTILQMTRGQDLLPDMVRMFLLSASLSQPCQLLKVVVAKFLATRAHRQGHELYHNRAQTLNLHRAKAPGLDRS